MSHYASNLIKGAGTGAAAGSAAGPWGALIGGVGGGLAGLLAAWEEEEDEERKEEILRQAANDLDISYNEIEQLFTEYHDNFNLGKAYGFYKKDPETGDDVIDWEKLGASAKAINNFDIDSYFDKYGMSMEDKDGDGKPDAFEFAYNKEVTDFLNPYYQDVIDKSNQAVTASAAGAAMGRGTGAAQSISENTAREYDKLYNTALNQFNIDRSQAYTEFSDYIKNMNDRLNTAITADQWKIGQQQNLTGQVMDQEASFAEAMAGMAQDKANTKTQITLAGI